MADKDLADIFNTAAGSNPPEAIEKEGSDIKDLFQAAHDAPTTIDQVASQEASPQWSKLQSAGQGALQGSTLGLSDELGGAEGAIMEKLAGNPDKKSLEDLYKEYRDYQRKRNDQAQQANPGSYLAGNVAGTALPAMIPGAASVGGGAALGATAGLGSSNADLVNPDLDSLKEAGKDIAIGGTLGAAGGALGAGIKKLLNPETLEAAGSKLASSTLGVPAKAEVAKVWNPITRQYNINSNVVKGIGSTANEEGLLSLTGGPDQMYEQASNAITRNQQKINPLLQQAQDQLNPILDDTLDNVGHIGDKTANFMQKYIDEIPESSQKNAIVNKIYKTYAPQLQNISQNDGNLVVLNGIKQDLQSTANSLNAYGDRKLGPEAQFVKQLGGLVRQHIEDLANAANPDSQLGAQIADTNSTLANLYTAKDAIGKTIQNGGKDSGLLSSAVSLPSKLITGYSSPQVAGIAGSKALLGVSKAVSTPLGQLVQRTATATPQGVVSSPFSVKAASSLAPTSNQRLSSNLYNATDDSLHQVASKMSQEPNVSHYGEALEKAISANDEQAKNNAIFLILQNPASRKLLKPEND